MKLPRPPGLEPRRAARFEAELHDMLRSRFPQDSLDVDHRVFALIAYNASQKMRPEPHQPAPPPAAAPPTAG